MIIRNGANPSRHEALAMRGTSYHLGVVTFPAAELAADMDTNHLALICPEFRGPSLVADRRSRIIHYANPSALRSIEASADLFIEASALQFFNTRHQLDFERSLAAMTSAETATSALAFGSQKDSRILTILCRTLSPIDVAAIKPVFRNDGLAANIVLLDLYLTDCEPEPAAFAALCAHHELSPTEARDLKLLVCGKTLEDIAIQRQVSLSTVRQNLKGILAKMHCNRQIELACMVFRLCPPKRL